MTTPAHSPEPNLPQEGAALKKEGPLARVNYFPGWRQLFFGYPFCFLPPLPPGGGPHCA